MKRIFGCKGGRSCYTDTCTKGVLRNKLWTSTAYYSLQPEHLGNYVYANRNENEESGDGYRYSVRCIIQLTERTAYDDFTVVHNRNNPDDIQDVVVNPDLLISSVKYGVESAFVFWFRKHGLPDRETGWIDLSVLAKTGTVRQVTQLVNGGQNGYEDRKARFNRIANLLGLNLEE